MAKRLVPASSRPLAALALVGALCACATTSAEPHATTQPAGWRIVERTGEARHLPPATAAWLSATIGEALAGGSEVSTGRGSRLILDAPGRNISAGPNSRFVLPGSDRDDRLDQQAGSLRYRVAEAARPLQIHTRSLELDLLAGVVDVHVDDLETAVTVREGQVRVAMPDGLRQTQMIAGQSAHAGGADEMQLAVRPAPGAELQPVELLIVPAIQPKVPATQPESTPAETPATSAPARSPIAGPTALSPAAAAAAPPAGRALQGAPMVLDQAPEARPQLAADVVDAPAVARHATGDAGAANDAAGSAMTFRSAADAPDALDPRRQWATQRATESPAAALRRAKFDRLTAGMLDQVEATSPGPNPTAGASR
jgi:hypothetical protein